MGSYKDNYIPLLQCGFCGKDKSEVEKLIAGPRVHICNQCLDVCIEIVVMDAIEECSSVSEILPSLSEVGVALMQAKHFKRISDSVVSSPNHP